MQLLTLSQMADARTTSSPFLALRSNVERYYRTGTFPTSRLTPNNKDDTRERSIEEFDAGWNETQKACPLLVEELHVCWDTRKASSTLFHDIINADWCLGRSLGAGAYWSSPNLARHHMLSVLGFHIDKLPSEIVSRWPEETKKQLEGVELSESNYGSHRYRFVNHSDYQSLTFKPTISCVNCGLADSDRWRLLSFRDSWHFGGCFDCSAPICTECEGEHFCGNVYLMRAEGTNRYKIGYATNVTNRVNAISTGCPYPIRIVASRSALKHHERWLHDRLDHWRVHLEWFEYHNEDRLKKFFLRDRERLMGQRWFR